VVRNHCNVSKWWLLTSKPFTEKPTLALISPAASARMAVAESLMNLAAADVSRERVCLSANWMAAAGHPGEAAALYEAVEAIGMELCPDLGIVIPVGKE